MRITTLLIAFLFLFGCKTKQPSATGKPPVPKDTMVVVEKTIPVKKEISLETKIGQMILIGINDRKFLTAEDSLRIDIASGKIGGIILFEKNIASSDQKETLKKLVLALQSGAPTPLFISIDEEGGKVHRLREKHGFIKMPSAAYLGAKPTTDSTFYYTKNLAALMAEIGINLNFAPDVDLAVNPNNPVIAKVERSYSANPLKVSEHALASIKAQHLYGIKTALKHFPGHGSSTTDSHLGITDVTKLWSAAELVPYKEIIKSGYCDAIMTAHIVNCKLDSTCLPATLSKKIMTDLLRKELGFNGVIFSDDMQMLAISKNYGTENAIKMSILAGVDVLVFGNNVTINDKTTATAVHDIILKLVKSGEISESRIDESYKRIMELKGRKVN